MPRGARADSLIEIARNQLALEIGYWGYVRSGGEEEQFGWLVPVPHPVGMTNIFDEMFLDGSQASAQSDLARTVSPTRGSNRRLPPMQRLPAMPLPARMPLTRSP